MQKAIKRMESKRSARVGSSSMSAEVASLRALPDKGIDYSAIPRTESEDWRESVVGKFYRPIKQQLTLRVDADVLAWFKAQGAGYQTRINELLRAAMLRSTRR